MASGAQQPLLGWKDISRYLNKSERTVQRWERKGLPIHRHEAMGILAYPAELDFWVTNLIEKEAPLSSKPAGADTASALQTRISVSEKVRTAVFWGTGTATFAGLALALSIAAYGLVILAFCLGALFAVLTYRRGPDTLAARAFVAVYMIAAMSYICSGSTIPEVQASIVNIGTLPPSSAYVFVTGLKSIPLIILVFGTWALIGGQQDGGFRMTPNRGKRYVLLGILFVGVEIVALSATSGGDRIWKAALPGRWTILIGSVAILGANVFVWLAARRCFNEESISSRGSLPWWLAVGFLIIAIASFLVDRESNRINRYYLNTRRPQAFRVDNPGAIDEIPQLLRGPLKNEIGPDLMNLIEHDAVFRKTVQSGLFYKQNWDEAFQLTNRAVMFGYRPVQPDGRDSHPFVTIRFPKELADAFGFIPSAE